MGGCFPYRLKLVRESDRDEFPSAQRLFRKVTPFSFESMKKATNNFNPSGEIRSSVKFSKSYKGILDDWSQVVVVVYSNGPCIEFTSMISIMSGVKHKNVVELIGYCIEDDHRILVHEYVGEKRLDQLFSDAVVLDWPMRVSICRGIAFGLDYLHNGISPRVVHCDIKPSNVLMDCSFNPKIAGFELSCLLMKGESHCSRSRDDGVYGTIGYIDLELHYTGRYSEKTDVYAFGITLLAIVSGTQNTLFTRDPGVRNLEKWAWKLRRNGRISEIVDQKLSEFSEDEVTRLVIVALSCVQSPSDCRPSMSQVRLMLSDSYDYNNIVLPLHNPFYTVHSQQVSSDSELSVNSANEEDSSSVNVTRLSLQSLKVATDDFNPSREVRHNGFSKSYKGTLDDGIEVVVKVYNTEDRNIDFDSMIKIMSGIAHINVVKLIGYCIEDDHKILVHEFVGDSSLDQLLFSDPRLLNWPKRVSVCNGIARALDYLHNECSPRVVLHDVKTSNILIDNNFIPKIVDFEVSRLLDGGESDHSDETTGRYSAKTDVYAFGITLLDIVNGSKVWLFWQGHGKTSLVDRALELQANGTIPEIVDPTLSEFSEAEVICLVNVALSCVQSMSHLRPSMSEVKQMLPSGD